MSARVKILIGGIVIAGALVWLGFVGFQESKAYYITVEEYSSMHGTLGDKTLKLAGEVLAGSVDRSKPQMEFILASQDKKIRVRYAGKDIIPDTFKDGTKALVEGKADADGVFQATHIEAKCASKYEAEYEQKNNR
jgi:cytochrome c-type biogenesis protein CcmE